MDITPTPFEALQTALERAGSQSQLARICEVSQPAVWKWLQSSKRLPGEHV
jgi:DNA-binding transcriptional regulator YdaS (Cro superfamily)